MQTFEPVPGRASLVARIEGSDRAAPALLLMGHTDVVPANPSAWRHDPFAADLEDGVVWGRGAVDMLNLTASMAAAVRRLAASGFRPRGTLVFLGVADEEAGGAHGAEWLVDHAREAVSADWVVTESGGIPFATPAGPRLWITVGEKGICWTRLTVRGTAGHGSRPLYADNALVTAAEVVRRLAAHHPATRLTDVWRRWVDGMAFPPELREALLDPALVDGALQRLPRQLARQAHAVSRMTVSPTVVHGGSKTNVIPDRIDIDLDIRVLPGEPEGSVDAMLDAVLGDVRDRVEVSVIRRDGGSVSPVETPLWDALSRASTRLHPGAVCVPSLTAGGTDARFFRRLGIPAYGFGLFSERLSYEDFLTMYHGNDERVDQESLALSVRLWESVARDLLG